MSDLNRTLYKLTVCRPKLVLLSCVKIPQDFQRVFRATSFAATYRAEFFFDIPESITVPSYERHTEEQLPPSIRVVKTPSSTEIPEHCRAAIAGNCDVTYHIETRMLRGKKVVGDIRREIIVMPSSETPPPLDPEDLQKEYRLYAASSMGSFWNPKKSVAVTILSKEPRPLVFPVVKEECAPGSTEVLLNFRTQKMYDVDFEQDLLEPPFTECEIMVTLEAITYFVDREKEWTMSVAEARTCPSAILKKRFKPQKRKLKLAGWKRVDDAICKSPKFNSSTSNNSAQFLFQLHRIGLLNGGPQLR